ncbi:hypothetical protein IFR05_008458 [Cadophora sp. M221]|nr:hypothetical protein IFR05_008458 [Cadophora sp. M221]
MGSIALHPVEELHLKETSFPIPTAPYPRPSSAPPPVTPSEIQAVVDKSIAALNATLHSGSLASLSSLMAKTSYWRDHLGLSPTKLSTLNGAEEIVSLIGSSGLDGGKSNITSLILTSQPSLTNLDPKGSVKCIMAPLSFTTLHGSGEGIIRWIQDAENNDEWRIYTLFTSLSNLSATPFLTGRQRPQNAKPDSAPRGTNWFDWRQQQREFVNEEPTVLIIGAGHSGLMLAARLKMLGVSALVVDRNQRTGDSWRLRYRDLVMHDPCWMNAMPYLKYPPSWPVAPKDKMADFLAYYETALDLNLWNSTQLVDSSWDEIKKEWTVVLERNQDGKISRRTLHPHHLIQATGLNGEPRMPSIPGMSTFTGPILHSTQFNNPSFFAGKKVIVVGTDNSGHDISQGLYHAGASSVTIIQRSPTFVLSLSSAHGMLASSYNEDCIAEESDIKIMSLPTTLFKHIGSDASSLLAPLNQELWNGLEKAGFRTVSPPSATELPSLLSLIIQRAGGFYIDIGCSSLIASGAIGVKSSQAITHLTPTSMVFEDGEEIEADTIIFATGYSNGRVRTRKIFGDQVADSIEPIWGFDEQGEVRGVWRRSGNPGFWVAAGSFWLSRYYSRLLALQIKMVEEGLVEL